MRSYSLTHLSDIVLLRDLAALIAHDRVTTAALLAHIAEVDSRRLYAPAGYPSMYAYCVGELHLSEDAAKKRIQAARASRQFTLLFGALAEGRLHLTAVSLLAPHLTAENAERLVEAATHRSKAEIEEWLARRYPGPELLSMVRVLPGLVPEGAPVEVGHVLLQGAPGHVGNDSLQHAPAHAEGDAFNGGGGGSTLGGQEGAPGRVDPRAEVAAERFLLQLTIGKSTREKLRYAQALLSHAVPSGDLGEVLDRALDALIVELEKRKLGVSGTPSGRRLHNPPLRERSVVTAMAACSRPTRYVSARVRRAVWERDGGQCTFVGASGHRCESRRFLEFDHIDPVARGGRATVDGMRLRCRAHNQYEAERVFGARFMSERRREARLPAAAGREWAARNVARGTLEVSTGEEQNADKVRRGTLGVTAGEEEAAREQALDVCAGLRNLGCRADEARRVAALTETLQCLTLEERMRAALTFIGRR